jgi:beta-glucosidase
MKKISTFRVAVCLAFACAIPAMLPLDARVQSTAAWPKIMSPIKVNPAQEARIRRIVAGMTLEQKIGQMTQPDIRYVTPDDVRTYYIGSVLNGGGAWPGMDRNSSASTWAKLSDAYYQASMHTGMATPVPVIWGIDAVHGNNNVKGATLFPHNIGLGAAHDPALIEKIGAATARSVRATGITWAFAPTLAVAQDMRWGRSYESWSADPAEVRAYGAAMVRGLQGKLGSPTSVLATAKHYIGDGGTFRGQDEGDTRVPLSEMIRTHSQGYVGALDAGAQIVMASYSSWNGQRMHGNTYLLTDVLKRRWGFDGFVVSDWDAIRQVPGCTISDCPAAINAGVDMVMVSQDWKAFIANTTADVRAGRIPIARIDDAVSRILRVKLRSGLLDGSPARAPLAGDDAAMVDRGLARQAVRESLVLLKNNHSVLPLARNARILVVGKGADSLAMQSGGWSRTWQGDDTTNADYTPAETLLGALRSALGDANVTYSADAQGIDFHHYDAVIAVVGEAPYAEYKGDITWPAALQHSARYPDDLKLLDAVQGQGVPVVTVMYSGRTTYANDLINRSDAFVAAFLPGSEAGGIADVLLRNRQGKVDHDFRGRLSFAWLGDPCRESVALFPTGYGLSYARRKNLSPLPESHGIVAGDGSACRTVPAN